MRPQAGITRPGLIALCLFLIPLLLASCVGRQEVPVKVTALSPADSIPYPESPRGGDFLLGPGDIMEIRFLGDKQLNTEVLIRPDGYISIPLVPESIMASGMSLAELELELESQIGRYLVNNDIYLNLTSVGSQQIFVLGEVRNPQIVKVQPSTLASVLSECGGLTREARAGQILVIRKWNQDQPVVFEINFDSFLDGESLIPDMPLQRYDIVIVPQSRITEVAEFLKNTFESATAVPRFGTELIYFFNILNHNYSGYRY